MKTKNNKTYYYFTDETENAIVKYNTTSDNTVKNELFTQQIQQPFYKIVECLIHRYKYYSCDENNLKNMYDDIVSFMVINIDKYNPNSGKAFSYFSVMAKNYLTQMNNRNSKYTITKKSLDYIDTTDMHDEEYQKTENNNCTKILLEQFIGFFDKYSESIFINAREHKVASAIIDLLRKSDNLEYYNKKAFYIIVKEITNEKTLFITFVLNKVKQLYYTFKFNRYSIISGSFIQNEFF